MPWNLSQLKPGYVGQGADSDSFAHCQIVACLSLYYRYHFEDVYPNWHKILFLPYSCGDILASPLCCMSLCQLKKNLKIKKTFFFSCCCFFAVAQLLFDAFCRFLILFLVVQSFCKCFSLFYIQICFSLFPFFFSSFLHFFPSFFFTVLQF